MKKVMKKRAGFTLVELLIVIIIIGILAGAMLLVAGSGTDKAEATKIVSNLRSIKAAALMYYADNPGENPDGKKANEIFEKYMDKKMPDDYQVKTISDDAVWFVGFADAQVLTTGVKEKLDAVAVDSGLYGSAAIGTAPATDADNIYKKYDGDAAVWMRAR